VNGQLAQQASDVDPSRTVGFTVFYEANNQLSVDWNSGSVNYLNHGTRAAPMQFRQPVIDAISNATGFNVRSR
jgi:hypothetical protein